MISYLPKISIIIPVYNVEDFVVECLQSVVRQTYKGEIECILVDDCGSDNSVDKAEKFIASYHGTIIFQILHHSTNRGLSAARNTGTDVATGEYIFYLDSDDYISDDCIETLVTPLRGDKHYDMVLGDIKMFGNPCDIIFLPQEEGEIIGNEVIFINFYSLRTIYVMAWNKLVKTSLLRQYNISFLEGQIHEDELWTYKCSCVLTSLYVSKRVTYYYRIRCNSITAEYSSQLIKRLNSCFKTIDYVLGHPASVSELLYDQCVIYYFNVYLRNIYYDNLDFRKDYYYIRERFKYNPYKLLFKGMLTKLELKRQLHLFLPPILGYTYLKIIYFKRLLLQ